MKVMCPDLYVSRFSQITPECLLSLGVKYILTDADETLVGHGEKEPTKEVERWVEAMKRAGLSVCIVSNNSKKRIAPFARKLGVDFVCRAQKPKPGRIRLAMTALGYLPGETVFIGDQIYTDLRAGQRVGAKTVLVDPIVGEKHHFFVDLRRAVWDKPIRRTFERTK